MRSRSSAAAASVNVIAASRSICSAPAAISSTMRATSAVVLPVPAPPRRRRSFQSSERRAESRAGHVVRVGHRVPASSDSIVTARAGGSGVACAESCLRSQTASRPAGADAVEGAIDAVVPAELARAATSRRPGPAGNTPPRIPRAVTSSTSSSRWSMSCGGRFRGQHLELAAAADEPEGAVDLVVIESGIEASTARRYSASWTCLPAISGIFVDVRCRSWCCPSCSRTEMLARPVDPGRCDRSSRGTLTSKLTELRESSAGHERASVWRMPNGCSKNAAATALVAPALVRARNVRRSARIVGRRVLPDQGVTRDAARSRSAKQSSAMLSMSW